MGWLPDRLWRAASLLLGQVLQAALLQRQCEAGHQDLPYKREAHDQDGPVLPARIFVTRVRHYRKRAAILLRGAEVRLRCPRPIRTAGGDARARTANPVLRQDPDADKVAHDG